MATKLTPTTEQKAILNAAGHRVKINARAGTGKTATMQMLAEKLHGEGESVLYLAFNSRTKKEASLKLGSAAKAMTVHAFALSCVPQDHGISQCLSAEKQHARDQGRRFDWPDMSPANFLPLIENQDASLQLRASLIHNFLFFFLNSQFDNLDEATTPYEELLAQNLRTQFHELSSDALAIIRNLIKRWTSGSEVCPHDYYLKRAIIEGWFARRLSKYSILLIDEAQDLSPVMIEPIDTFEGRVFFVGDSHQQIYSFRHAIDALERMQAVQEFELTRSFRFGTEIASVAEGFIREVKNQSDFVIRGNKEVHSSVVIQDIQSLSLSRNATVISRSNYGLFQAAIFLLNAGRSIAFNRRLGGLIQQAEAVYQLSSGKNVVSEAKLIASFKKFEHLAAYADEVDDRMLKGMVRLVKEHGSKLPGILARLKKVPSFDPTKPLHNRILLTTIHGAKGLEFQEVLLADDMLGKLDSALQDSSKTELLDEANMVYVALTRAKRRLSLPSCVSALSTNWPGEIEASQSTAANATMKTNPIRQARNSSPESRWVRRSPSGPRVVTRLGHGHLIESGTRDNTYLVKLDGKSEPVRLMKRLVRIEGD